MISRNNTPQYRTGYCAHAEAAALAQSNGVAQSFASAAATDPTVQSCLGSSSNAVAKAVASANSAGGNANANAAAAVRDGFPVVSLPVLSASIHFQTVSSGALVLGHTTIERGTTTFGTAMLLQGNAVIR